MNKIVARRSAAAVGVVAAAAVAAAGLGAGTAAAGPLAGGSASKKFIDGTTVNVKLTNERVTITPSTVALPTSRNVWLSGKIDVDVSGGAKGGNVEAGYVVGCQMQFGAEGGAKGGPSAKLGSIGPKFPDSTAELTGEASGGFTLKPGEATTVPIIQDKDDDDNDVNSFDFKGNKGGFVYSQETFKVDGCAGYASARAYVKVTVETDAVTGIVTMWGKPFSIG